MADTLRTSELTVVNPEVIECPYATYARLREEDPIHFDPIGRFYILSRYDDVRAALLDPDTYVSDDWMSLLRDGLQKERARRAEQRFSKEGWVPGPSIGMLPPARHAAVRAVFDNAFRVPKIMEYDDFIRDTAYRLVERLVPAGKAELISEYAVPFPLAIIGKLTGIPEADMAKVKAWTDSWISRLGMMLSDEEENHAISMEIEFQHYTKQIIDRLRAKPDGSLLSDIVNVPKPDGTTLDDAELFTHLNADLLVAGGETTTNAISAGVMLMCENPAIYEKLKSDPETYIPRFAEEVVRLESPAQGLFRIAGRDIELHGKTIPKGSLIQLRYGSANRDSEHFNKPDDLDLQRRSSGSHVGYGTGVHRCAGAHLARRELFWTFKALVTRLDNIQLAPENDFSHLQSIIHRALKQLYITYSAKH